MINLNIIGHIPITVRPKAKWNPIEWLRALAFGVVLNKLKRDQRYKETVYLVRLIQHRFDVRCKLPKSYPR